MKQPVRWWSAALPIAALLGLAGLPTPAHAAPVAYVEASRGGTDLAHEIRVKRGGKPVPVKGRYLNLEAGDEITLRKARGQVAVRYLGNNAVHWVRRNMAGGFDYRVRAVETASLGAAVFDWLVQQVVGSSSPRPYQEITASSRSARDQGSCGATVNGSAAAFQLLNAAPLPSRIVRDGKSVVISWLGGSAPYRIAVDGVPVAGDTTACQAALDPGLLKQPATTLTLTDGQGAQPQTLVLQLEPDRPAMPEVLATATIPEVSRQLYYASWLAALDGGIWAIEAQRVALAQDCQQPEVRAWLNASQLRSACD